MPIIKRNGDVYTSIPSLFNDLFRRDGYNWDTSNYSNTGTTIPAVNIKETADAFEVEMAAPGMTKEDFRIELDGNMLTISSEKNNQYEESESQKYSRKEFSYESFQRSFQLPKEVVDVERINATYQNGVLCLMIPKREEIIQKPKTITIS